MMNRITVIKSLCSLHASVSKCKCLVKKSSLYVLLKITPSLNMKMLNMTFHRPLIMSYSSDAVQIVAACTALIYHKLYIIV